MSAAGLFTSVMYPDLPKTLRQPSANALRDHALTRAALGHDEKAYAELLHRYHKPLYYLVLRIVRHPDDALDLTQETFVKAFRNLATFCPDYAFSTWLFRIGTNTCLDFLRRQRLPTISLHAPLPGPGEKALLLDFPDHDPTPQEALLRAETHQALRQTVGLLPPRYRKLVERRYFDEYTLEELAVEFNRPVGTIKAQLFKARGLLHKALSQSASPR